MRKGFITPIILLTIVAFAVYFLYKNYAEVPNALTEETAANFLKYPNSQNWNLKRSKNFCLQKEDCSQPITITFESQDPWNQAYGFYKEQLTERGWHTNSIVITSIPSGVIFTNSVNCEAYLTKNSLGYFGVEKSDNGKFSIKVACPAASAS